MAADTLQCQHCRCRLALKAGEGDGLLRLSSSGSVSSKLEESFMLLEEVAGGRNLQQQGGSGSGEGSTAAGAASISPVV